MGGEACRIGFHRQRFCSARAHQGLLSCLTQAWCVDSRSAPGCRHVATSQIALRGSIFILSTFSTSCTYAEATYSVWRALHYNRKKKIQSGWHFHLDYLFTPTELCALSIWASGTSTNQSTNCNCGISRPSPPRAATAEAPGSSGVVSTVASATFSKTGSSASATFTSALATHSTAWAGAATRAPRELAEFFPNRLWDLDLLLRSLHLCWQHMLNNGSRCRHLTSWTHTTTNGGASLQDHLGSR